MEEGSEEDEENKGWIQASPDSPDEENISDEILTLQRALDEINREKIKAYTEGGPMFISDKKNGTFSFAKYPPTPLPITQNPIFKIKINKKK